MKENIKRLLALFTCFAVISVLLIPANAAVHTEPTDETIQEAFEEIRFCLDEIGDINCADTKYNDQTQKNAIEKIHEKRRLHADENNAVVADEAYAAADALFEQLDNLEVREVRNNKSASSIVDAAEALILDSEYYDEGTLIRNGDSFTWWTTDGIRCVYSPRMREIYDEMERPSDGLKDGVYNEPRATKNSFPSGKDVYLIGPYYGHDDTFTDQYIIEAERIAASIGDKDGYTLYSGTAATVDNIAKAISDGAVVIFDSHGDTDYANGDDYVTGANNSYLCLTSTSGLTSADYSDGALYFSEGIYINGATISNHMKSNSPSGILWMAICLGMATDTLCEPLRDRGVEVVYGYSQSVSFAGDYLFEETFWNEMCAGSNVASAIGNMKKNWGCWDWSTQIAEYYGSTDGAATISAARNDYLSFPIVVSDEDAHPGQKGKNGYGADNLQTVRSGYTLFDPNGKDVFGYQVLDGAVFAPIIADYTDEDVELVPIDGFEYSKDGINWQSFNGFNGLKPGTQYKIYQRQKADGTKPAGEVSPATVVRTADRGESTVNNYEDLANYIDRFGFVDDEGYSYLYDSFNNGDVYCDLLIFNYDDGIYLELLTTAYSGANTVETYTEYIIYPDLIGSYATVGVFAYSNGYLVDEVWDNKYIYRADLTADSNYTFPYTYGYVITSSQFTSFYNSTMDILLALSDMNINSAIGNGLKGFGFFSYTSGNGYYVCDPLLDFHSGNTELRNKRSGNCCIPGYSGDIYCSDCGTKLQSGELIAVKYPHMFDNGTDAGCILCGTVPTDVDFTGDGMLTDADAIYLLRYTLFPEKFPISMPADFTGDSRVTDSDAIYLLRHTLFPEQFPI